MSVFESIIYGIVSGLTEFLPVSSQGHQAIMLRLFGQDTREPIRDLLVHIAILAALIFSCRSMLIRLRREHMIMSRSRRKRTYDFNGIYDLRLIKTAVFPMMIGLIAYSRTIRFESQPLYLALFFLINGMILIIPEYARQGNKRGRSMSGFDGILLGVFSALSSIPGISRVGSGMCIASLRGADRVHNLNWALLLSIPALVIWIVLDFVHIFTIGVGNLTFISILTYMLSAIFAFAGGFMGVSFVRFLSEKAGFSGFAYYSWGAAMFTFVLYLIA